MGEERVVVIIFGGEAFRISGESGEPRRIPVESVTEVVFFDDCQLVAPGSPAARADDLGSESSSMNIR